MIEKKQEIFTEFMNEFVKLNDDQKNDEIIEKEKMILGFLFKYANEHGIQYEFLKSREINDIINHKGTQSDYLESIMVYIENIEELIGLILNSD